MMLIDDPWAVASILEYIDEGVVLLSKEGCILGMNRTALAWCGWEGDKVVGQSFAQELKKEALCVPFPAGYVRGSSTVVPLGLATGGNERMVEWRVTSYPGDNDQEGILLIGKDCTELQTAEAKIFELDSILAQVPGNLYWFDKEGVYLGCNQKSAEVLGIPRSEAIGQNFRCLMRRVAMLNEGDIEVFMQHGQAVIGTGVPLINIEEPGFAGADGKMRYYLANKLPLRNKAGKVYGVIGISIDITERRNQVIHLKKSKEAAELSSQLKTSFIENLTHDLRTPLMGVCSMIDTLRAEIMDLETQSQVRLIEKSAEQLLYFINDMLASMCLSQELSDEKASNFDLKQMLCNLHALYQPAMQEKELQYSVQYSESLETVFFGAHQSIQRIFMNLLGNAVKFTEQGAVTVNVSLLRKEGDMLFLRCSVTDTGIGIPADKIPAVFDRFTRVSPSNQGRYSGTGLGLSMVRELVESLKGRVWVESVLGEGACFVCEFPLQFAGDVSPGAFVFDAGGVRRIEDGSKAAVVREVAAVTFDRVCKRVGFRKSRDQVITCLVVEDTEIVQVATKLLFKRAGYDFDLAATGQVAIDYATEQPYDIIFMDVGLPDISGYAVTRTIRKLRNNTNAIAPILGLTAHMDDNVRASCAEAGMNAMLIKPLTIKQLNAVLEQHVWASEAVTESVEEEV